MSESWRVAWIHWMLWCNTVDNMGLYSCSFARFSSSKANLANEAACSREYTSLICNSLRKLDLLSSNRWILFMQSLLKLRDAFRQAWFIVLNWEMTSLSSSDSPERGKKIIRCISKTIFYKNSQDDKSFLDRTCIEHHDRFKDTLRNHSSNALLDVDEIWNGTCW